MLVTCGFAGAVSEPDGSTYLCVQRGGQLDSFVVSFHRDDVHGFAGCVSFAGDDGDGGEHGEIFSAGAPEFRDPEYGAAGASAGAGAGYLAGDAADFILQRVFAAGSGVEPGLGSEEKPGLRVEPVAVAGAGGFGGLTGGAICGIGGDAKQDSGSYLFRTHA